MGDLFSLKGFIQRVNDGFVIDYDGSGYYAIKGYMNGDAVARPSDIKNGKIDRRYTHIAWFNR